MCSSDLRTAAQLEARQLQRRWSSLRRCLAELGEASERRLAWRGLETNARWQGQHLVLVQARMPQASDRLELWLLLQLACAAAGGACERPQSAILIAREGHNLQKSLTLAPVAPEQAAAELERLLQLRHSWRERCWPVPPRTGWAYLEAEAKRSGQGRERAAAIWEGSPQLQGERQRPEMVVCFGADRPAEALLTGEFADQAIALYGPLLEAQP